MIPYRQGRDDPSRTEQTVRTGAHTLSPVAWFFIGVGVLLILAVVWLMPLSAHTDPLTWLGRMLGLTPSRSGSYEFQRSSMVMPAVLGLLMLSALAGALAVYRRRTAAAVLGHLAAAVDLRVPLPPFLRAAADGERRAMRRRLNRLAHDLSAGRSVGAALSDAAGELPELTLDRIAAAEKSFALNHALAEQLQRERLRLAGTPVGSGLAYFFVLGLTVFTVVYLIMIFVIPKYAQIFADFRLRLPAATQLLIDFAHAAGGYGTGGPLVMAVMLLVQPLVLAGVCVLLPSATRGLFTSRPRRGWLRPLFDRVRWYAPVFGRLTRDRHHAAACEATAEALSAGRTLPEAIALATLPGLNAVLRHRLRRWRERVEAGEPAATAARAAGLPRLWCDLMGGVASDPTAASAFAGRAYAAAWGRRAAVLEAVVPVLLTLLAAGVVGFVALALFTPILSLIDSVPVTGRFRR